MRKFFNASGPCNAEKHYMIGVNERIQKIHTLIDNERYFILHAPRQTGKTTCMTHLVKQLNIEGKYIAIYVNIESAQAVKEDVERANRLVLGTLKRSAKLQLSKELFPSEICFQPFSMDEGINHFFTEWCFELPKPLIVFIDEIDSLMGDALLSVLRQLRSGYTQRPERFPHSLCLIGIRDIRDYRIYSDREKRYVTGGSCFNVKERALVLENFTQKQVIELYMQHTDATGQQFTKKALKYIYDLTQGQPWLVNALGRELCFDEHAIDRNKEITVDHVEKIKEILILRRDVHLDQLADKLTEPRVANIIQLMITGDVEDMDSVITSNDKTYVINLGLVRHGPLGLEIANPIYREIIIRELTSVTEQFLGQNPVWYIKQNGKLDIEKLLSEYIKFYKEHSEMVTKRKMYTEAAHHMLFMAWIQRITNSGGKIIREYAAGLKRLDMLVEFAGERFAFELKRETKNALKEGKDQLSDYLDRLSLTSGYLIIFNRKEPTNWDTVGKRETVVVNNKTIEVIYI
ncbi:ATPase, AAA-type, core domain protein [Candidatus Magnetomorum sp. HK-1]|nr:ATPase, AAA-type, core domain protein [Candidatus Magnetomorum sp. HK-1]